MAVTLAVALPACATDGADPVETTPAARSTQSADDDTLRVFLLAGQSNAGGYGFAYDRAGGQEERVTSIEYLLADDPDPRAYRASITADGSYPVLADLDESWLEPRDDVWAVAYRSDAGISQPVLATPSSPATDEARGVQPLSPGFGLDDFHAASFGPELAMGHRLGQQLEAPVLIVKSTAGGTSLAEEWRSALAAEDRGGAVGASYTNTVAALRQTLDALEADLADDGVLNRYGNATDFVVAGLVWVHGWNDHLEAAFVSEYEANLVDLIESIRQTHPRISDALPVVVVESADRDSAMNAARTGAVAELNDRTAGSAVFVETGDLLDRGLGPEPADRTWSDTLDFHFHGKAENYLELGWRAAGALIDHDHLG